MLYKITYKWSPQEYWWSYNHSDEFNQVPEIHFNWPSENEKISIKEESFGATESLKQS